METRAWRLASGAALASIGPYLAVAGWLGWWRGVRAVDSHHLARFAHAHGAARLLQGEVAHDLRLAALVSASVVALAALAAWRRWSVAALGLWASALQLGSLPGLFWLWHDWRAVRIRQGLELPAMLWREEARTWAWLAGGALLVAAAVHGIWLRRRNGGELRVPRACVAVGTVGALLGLLPLALSAREVASTRPDVIPARNALWLTWDSTRADHLSVYGYARPTTPNLERLAADAVLYERNYSQHNWTRPSYATMLTSRHTFDMPAGGLAPRVATIAEELRDAGFATVAFGQNPNLDSELGFDQGFDRFVQVHHDVRATEVAELVVRTLDELRSGDRPFFVFAHMQQPHWPYVVGGPYTDEFGAGPAELVGERRMEKLMRHRMELWDEDGPESERELDWMLDMYDADTRLADEAVGLIVEHARDVGLLANTVLAFNSDHGDEFLDRGDFGHGHGNLHPELTHVPLIVRYPDELGGVEEWQPRRADELTQNLDVFPTLLDALGVEVPDRLSGRSLLDLSEDAAEERIVLSTNSWRVAVRRGTRTLIFDARRGDRWYFDRGADLGEWEPLPLDDDDPDLARLQQAADEWLEKRVANDPPTEAKLSAELEERLRDLGYL